MSIVPIDPQMTGVLWAQTSKEQEINSTTTPSSSEYDVVVIGGGFCGLSIALNASLEGLTVLLIEAGKIGNGASGRNGGFVVPQFPGAITPSDVEKIIGPKKTKRFCEIVGRGPAFVFEQIEKFKIQCDPEQNGWVQPAHSSKALARTRKVFSEWSARGVDVQWLDSDKVGEMLGSPKYNGGWLAPTGGTINPYALCLGLARVFINKGGVVCENSPVTEIGTDNSQKIVKAGGQVFKTNKVVITTNAYTNGVYPELDKTIIPVRLFHAVTKPLTAEQQKNILPSRVCFTDLRKSGGVARYDPEGRIISAGAVFSIGDARSNAESHVKKRINLLFPQLVNPEIEHYWEGYCALTQSHLPSVQVLGSGIYAVLGFSTRGVSLAQNLGREFSRYLAGNIPIDDLPVQVCGLDKIPFQVIQQFLGGYAFPVFKAMDRLKMS